MYLRIGLIAALVTIGASSIAGGAFARGECQSSKDEPQCNRPLLEEWGDDGRCYECRWRGKDGCLPEADPKPRCLNGFFFDLGARGPAVKELQRALKEKNFNVDVTGTYDERTKEAVKSFQAQKNLKNVDGIAGPETLGKLAK